LPVNRSKSEAQRTIVHCIPAGPEYLQSEWAILSRTRSTLGTELGIEYRSVSFSGPKEVQTCFQGGHYLNGLFFIQLRILWQGKYQSHSGPHFTLMAAQLGPHSVLFRWLAMCVLSEDSAGLAPIFKSAMPNSSESIIPITAPRRDPWTDDSDM
jgi:hypothetical protein